MASVELFPVIGKFIFILNPEPHLEVRGVASIVSIQKTEVLLNPQVGGTFLPNNFPLPVKRLTSTRLVTRCCPSE
jgi:hypothetical protein